MKSDENNGIDPAEDAAVDDTVSLTKPGAADSGSADAAAAADVSLDKDGADEASADADPADSTDEPTEESSAAAEQDTVVPAGSAPDEESRHWLASLALAGAAAALVAAVVCLGYFGYTGIRAYTVDSAREEVRNAAVDGAEQAMLNIMSIDSSSPKAWQERMKSSLTGDALKQAISESDGAVKQIEAAKEKNLTIKAKVIRSAATEVNADEETATVLVFAQATSSMAPDRPQPQSNLITMVKSDGTWKASKIVPLTGIAYDQNSAQPTLNEGGN